MNDQERELHTCQRCGALTDGCLWYLDSMDLHVCDVCRRSEQKENTVKKLPPVRMRLVGEDGSAFAILGRFRQAARRAGWKQTDIQRVLETAMSGNYDHLLATIVRHVEEPEEESDVDN